MKTLPTSKSLVAKSEDNISKLNIAAVEEEVQVVSSVVAVAVLPDREVELNREPGKPANRLEVM